MNIEDIIKPETDFEKRLVRDPELRTGLMYRATGLGHPEEVVLYHVRNVLRNIDRLRESNARSSLRVIAMTHDTFKYLVLKDKPKTGVNNHGVLARKFLERYNLCLPVLEVTELHDAGYYAWRERVVETGKKQKN